VSKHTTGKSGGQQAIYQMVTDRLIAALTKAIETDEV
jgi:hypothetical protein